MQLLSNRRYNGVVSFINQGTYAEDSLLETQKDKK